MESLPKFIIIRILEYIIQGKSLKFIILFLFKFSLISRYWNETILSKVKLGGSLDLSLLPIPIPLMIKKLHRIRQRDIVIHYTYNPCSINASNLDTIREYVDKIYEVPSKLIESINGFGNLKTIFLSFVSNTDIIFDPKAIREDINIEIDCSTFTTVEFCDFVFKTPNITSLTFDKTNSRNFQKYYIHNNFSNYSIKKFNIIEFSIQLDDLIGLLNMLKGLEHLYMDQITLEPPLSTIIGTLSPEELNHKLLKSITILSNVKHFSFGSKFNLWTKSLYALLHSNSIECLKLKVQSVDYQDNFDKFSKPSKSPLQYISIRSKIPIINFEYSPFKDMGIPFTNLQSMEVYLHLFEPLSIINQFTYMNSLHTLTILIDVTLDTIVNNFSLINQLVQSNFSISTLIIEASAIVSNNQKTILGSIHKSLITNSNLTSLSINRFNISSQSLYDFLRSNNSNIKTLKLSNINNLEPKELVLSINQNRYLKTLSILDLHNLSESYNYIQTIKNILESNQNLTSLSLPLNFPISFTDQEITILENTIKNNSTMLHIGTSHVQIANILDKFLISNNNNKIYFENL